MVVFGRRIVCLGFRLLKSLDLILWVQNRRVKGTVPATGQKIPQFLKSCTAAPLAGKENIEKFQITIHLRFCTHLNGRRARQIFRCSFQKSFIRSNIYLFVLFLSLITGMKTHTSRLKLQTMPSITIYSEFMFIHLVTAN